jgi:hypothetical protein
MFLELDIDAVMALYSDNILDINMAEGDLNSYFNDI